MNSLLEKEFIQIENRELEWEEAIDVASQPLLNANYIDKKYIKAMIDGAKELGPYMVVTPNVALPHSRPENGVNETGLSMLLSKKPVDFNIDGKNNEYKVHIIIVLAAKNSDEHLKTLQKLGILLENESNIKLLQESSSVKEIDENIEKILKGSI